MFLDNNTGLLVGTNKRIIFIDSGMVFGVKKTDINIKEVSSVSVKKGLVLGEIEITMTSGRILF